MRKKTVESLRVSLLVLGLVLLIVFGVRAAGGARDMKLAGALQHRIESAKDNMLGFLGFTQTPIAAPEKPQTRNAEPATNTAASANAQPAVPTVSPSPKANDKAVEALNKAKTNASATASDKAKSTLNKTTNTVNNSVTKITEDAGNEFTRIWP